MMRKISVNFFLYLTDADTGKNALITYSIISYGGAAKVFDIDARDGTITLKKPLDYESAKKSYALKVNAADEGVPRRSVDADVVINVLDVNDNDPAFTGVNEGSVMENVGPNQNVMKVTATDKDSGTMPLK